jgi:GTP diphosphokinase / guanosine-3',5'-bis(diphosphate) 3'-diphosphatase
MVESKTFLKKENRTSFEARLIGKFSPEDIRNIMFIYDIPKYAHGHKGQKRESGERYYEHPRSVALILLDECGVTDPAIIKGALMHDVGEDTGFLGNAYYLAYPQLILEIEYRAGLIAGKEAAEIVGCLTKPTGIDIDNKTANVKEELYRRNLNSSSPKALLVKMADRLHNLRTLGSCTLEKQQRKIKETEEFYFPLFEKVLVKYPKEGKYLLDQMKFEISKLRN